VPPLGGTPRLPALGGHRPRKGATTAGPRRRFRRTVDQTPPLARQAGDRTPRGARPGRPLTDYQLLAGDGCRIDPGATGSRHLHRLGRPTPFARSRSVVGPPVTRWANSLGISSLVDSTRRCERAAVPAYAPFGSPLRALLRTFRLGRDTPSPGGLRPRRRRTRLAPCRRPHGFRRERHRLSLSRARRTFVHRGVLRVASFR
jgi:hypothetical protein